MTNDVFAVITAQRSLAPRDNLIHAVGSYLYFYPVILYIYIYNNIVYNI